MALDRVHVRGLERHADRISRAIDERDYQSMAETVWERWLDPLVDASGRTVVEPLGDQTLRAIDVETAAALQAPDYDAVHGLDSGTINPTSYKNGLVLDVAQAAMAAEPSALDLHRDRTLVTTVHTADEAAVHEHEERLDEGHTVSRLLRAPRAPRFEENVVHELSLYLAESEHALDHHDAVTDLLVLDGPVYPKGLLNWADRPDLRDLLYDEPEPRDVVRNYLELVERSVERDVSLLGFVKNPSTKVITRTLRERDLDAPWVGDAALFTRLLERRELVETVDETGDRQHERRRDTDALTYTSWFRSRGGADRLLASGDGLDVDRDLEPDAYEVTFFALYDPRADLLYRVEAPYAVTRDPDRRERLARFVVREVATEQGPPAAVQKADELARIGRQHTATLRETLADAFGADQHRTYDDERWDEERAF